MTLGPQQRAFLRDSRIVHFATVSPRGAPFVTPLWFVERSGRLRCATSAASITVRNVEAGGRATLLVYPARAGTPDRVLRLEGGACVKRGAIPLGVVLAMARKYYVAPSGLAVELAHVARWGLRLRYYAQSSPALLEFTPEAADWLAVPAA